MIEKTVSQNTELGVLCLNALEAAGYRNLDSDSVDSRVSVFKDNGDVYIRFYDINCSLSLGDKYYGPVLECLKEEKESA